MTLDSLIGTTLFILQVLALCWAVLVGFRIVFGVGFDSHGQLEGKKPLGKALVRMGNKVTSVVEETTRGAAKVIKDLVGSNQETGDPEILEITRDPKVAKKGKKVNVEPAMRAHEEQHS